MKVSGQSKTYSDFQFWQRFQIQHSLSPSFSAAITAETRFTENVSQFNYYYLDASLIYKYSSAHRLTLDYVFVQKQNDVHFSSRNQYNISYQYRVKFHKYYLFARTLQEAQLKDYFTSNIGKHWRDFFLREKITLRYKLTKRWYPYIADEIYYRFDNVYHEFKGISRNRLYVGIDRRYKKSDYVFGTFFMLENNFNQVPFNNNYVVGMEISRELWF
jgi:hypothetical protein